MWAGRERLSATGNMRHDIILLTRHQVFICEYSNGGERLAISPKGNAPTKSSRLYLASCNKVMPGLKKPSASLTLATGNGISRRMWWSGRTKPTVSLG